MNDNERHIRRAERQLTTEPRSPVGSELNGAQLPNSIKFPGPVLLRQIDAWVNEGGADEK